MFTLETVVSFSLLSLVSLTICTVMHVANATLLLTQHRNCAQLLAWQYLEKAKQSHFRGNMLYTSHQYGVTFEVHVEGDPTSLEIKTEVTWHEKPGNQKQVSLSAFDFVPDST
jgi:hypothetical protein